MANDDPVRGLWYVEPSGAVSRVWCDASNIATGVALEVNGHVVEDCAWLRPSSDKRHINVAELDAAIKGLSLATKWKLSSVTVCTDSRTVAAWLTQVVNNTSRVKSSGLQEVLVRRRVQIFDDIIKTTGIAVNIEWVPSRDNKADILTRVPDDWRKRCHASSEDVCAAASSAPHGLSMDEIANGQLRDADITAAALAVKHRSELPQSFPDPYQRIRSQLWLRNEVLHRSVKLPIEGHVCVPVFPAPAQSVVSDADVDGVHSDNSEDDFDFLLDPSADASNPRLRSGYGLRPPAALQSPLRYGIACVP